MSQENPRVTELREMLRGVKWWVFLNSDNTATNELHLKKVGVTFTGRVGFYLGNLYIAIIAEGYFVVLLRLKRGGEEVPMSENMLQRLGRLDPRDLSTSVNPRQTLPWYASDRRILSNQYIIEPLDEEKHKTSSSKGKTARIKCPV